MLLRTTYWLAAFLVIALFARGQQGDTLTFAGVEGHSYRLYLDKDWKQLSAFCDRAIRADYDYYYLRMRAGIASYETGNYRKAIRHFLKALGFNSGDETAMRYLYESYQYAGQYEEARNISRRLDTASLRVTGADLLKALSFVSLEGAVKLSDSPANFRPATYIQPAAQHYINNRFSLFHAFTYYGQDEYRQKIKQYQYYLSSTIPLKHRLVLSPAVHVLYNNLSVLELSTTTSVSMTPTKPGKPPQQVVTVSTNTAYVPKQTSAIAGALTLTQKRIYGDVSLGVTACVFDTANQYQVQAGLTIYPFGNRKLALGALLYHHTETNYKQSNLAVVPGISSLINRKLLLSASWLSNRGGNVTESNAYLINNSIDVSLSRFNGMIEYSLLPHLNVYAVYSYDTRQEKFARFKYHYHLALLGIKFIP